MNLETLEQLLHRIPLIVQGLHPVSLAYLNEPVTVYSSLQELSLKIDASRSTQEHYALTLDNDPKYAARFPVVTVEHDPFKPDLNRILFDRFDFISRYMSTHANLADRIVAKSQGIETVVLILLDGLSYGDCRDWPGTEPCLAASPTITRVCFPTILGSPPLAVKLFALGLTRRVGFTYWEREDEPLTAQLFHTITDTKRLDSNHPNSFNQVLDWLSTNDLSRSYVQIVRTALDDYAEGQRTVVPRHAIIQQIRNDLDMVFDILKHKGRSAILFAVADHGILWKDECHDIEVVDFSGARYSKGRSGPGRGRAFEVSGEYFWVLDYPQMGRSWRSNEQGIHGGISYQESIVPFIQWETNQLC